MKYTKKVSILNKSNGYRKFRLLKITSPDEYDTLLFKIEPLLGIQKLASGSAVFLTVNFTPTYDFCPTEAEITFLSYDVESQQNQKFCVKIRCTPLHADLKISPADVSFGQISIWKTRGSNIKTIELKNEGKKPCKVVIKKNFNPLELPDTDISNEEDEVGGNVRVSEDITEELFENVFNVFSFEKYFIKLGGSENHKLKIKLKNVEHVGSYFEKFLIDVYEEEKCVGSQEIVIYAEVTGHFIELSTNILDFGVCITDSIYQLGLDVYNNSSCTQTLHVKFPSSVVDYIRAATTNVYVPPKTKITIWLKFSPRQQIFKERIPYFDVQTRILEFPIHICMVSRNYSDIPPIKVTVFAVLTDSNNVNIIPTNEKYSDYFPNGATLDLGECSIYETISTDIIIENDTLSPQLYGFVDLPECITISPNYGFGELGPGEKKMLKMFYHPDIKDVKSSLINRTLRDQIVFKLNLETLSNIGQMKQALCSKKLRKSIDLMIQELRSPGNSSLHEDMKICMEKIKCTYFPGENGDSRNVVALQDEYYGEICNESGKVSPKEFQKNTKSQLTVHAKIIRPLLEISSQYVEFPDTPCGSYSTTEIELKALKNEITLQCDFLKRGSKLSLPNYEAWFKITGDNDQIRVEPSCGILQKGESRKIVLIAKPTTLEHIVIETAKSIKYSEIYEMKKREIELAREELRMKKMKDAKRGKKKGDKKDKNKGKKGKKKVERNKPEKENEGSSVKDLTNDDLPTSEITVTEEELKLDYIDYFPAEMCYWRSLEPYIIKSKLIFTINYDSPDMIRKQEIIYLDVSCRVVKPDFITNLKQQRINFGTVAVEMTHTEYIILQNINYNAIEPKVSLLNPVGPFRVSYIRNCILPPEHYLKLPINFEPKQTGKCEEYLEITSGRTVLPLILEGIGLIPELDFKPNALVFRLNTARNKIAECTIEISNICNATVTVNFEKILELEGHILRSQKNIEKSPRGKSPRKGKKSNKKADKSKKSDKSVKKSVLKFSDTLTDAEETSIEKNFTKRIGDSLFDILNIDGNRMEIPGNSTNPLKLGFGNPDILLKKKMEIKEVAKKGKKRGKGKDKKSSSGTSKESKKATDKTYYLSKYNIKLSNRVIKEIILICFFK